MTYSIECSTLVVSTPSTTRTSATKVHPILHVPPPLGGGLQLESGQRFSLNRVWYTFVGAELAHCTEPFSSTDPCIPNEETRDTLIAVTLKDKSAAQPVHRPPKVAGPTVLGISFGAASVAEPLHTEFAKLKLALHNYDQTVGPEVDVCDHMVWDDFKEKLGSHCTMGASRGAPLPCVPLVHEVVRPQFLWYQIICPAA